mmetsp:Transcript_77043/g.135890  ORF Transcript_77043/g.135890 Transcript_77043/m.135890 type:complete len:584 (-) Transcript_77043:133-1884(-)
MRLFVCCVALAVLSASGESHSHLNTGRFTLEAEISASGLETRKDHALIRTERVKTNTEAAGGIRDTDSADGPHVMLSGDGISLKLTCAASAKIANTRCCSGSGAGVQLQSSGCFASQSYSAAAAACLANGYRVCTQAEVSAGKAKHAGCQFDATYIWTSTPCTVPPQKFWKVRGGGGTLLGPTCSPESSAANVHCCTPEGGATAEVIMGGVTGCHQAKSLQEAKAICLKSGGRVCSFDELKSGMAKSAGCSFDSTLVWSSTPCDSDADSLLVSGNSGSSGSGQFHKPPAADAKPEAAAKPAAAATPAASTEKIATENETGNSSADNSSAPALPDPDEYQGAFDLNIDDCQAFKASADSKKALSGAVGGLLGAAPEEVNVEVSCNDTESLIQAETSRMAAIVTKVTWSLPLKDETYAKTDELITSRIALFRPSLLAAAINDELQKEGSKVTVVVQHIKGLQKVYNSMRHSPNTTVTTTTTAKPTMNPALTTIVPVVIVVGELSSSSTTSTTVSRTLEPNASLATPEPPTVVKAVGPDPTTIVSAAAAPPPETETEAPDKGKSSANSVAALVMTLQIGLLLKLLA